MKPFLILLLATLTLITEPRPASGATDGFIWVNVSIKVIRDPATGQVPSTMNDALLRDSFIDMNRWLENTWRGFRLRAVDLDAAQNFKRIGTLHDTTGPGKWYSTNLKTDSTANLAFETEAEANKALYGWNDAAINIYFNNGGYSSAHSPANPVTPGRDLVQSAYGLLVTDLTAAEIASGKFAARYKVAGNLLHEIGHYFHLGHTFPEDDFADTAPDPRDDPVKRASDPRNESIVRDAIALYAYSSNYIPLSAANKTRVNNTANNAMSYYQLFYDDPDQNKYLTETERFGPLRFLFTELQLDRWADSANAECAKVTSGRTFFVGPGSHIFQVGSSALPYKTVAGGINAARAAGQDIVLLRPGSYNERLTLSKPCTLRATRTGKAVVGIP
jgi:hypothetical protein